MQTAKKRPVHMLVPAKTKSGHSALCFTPPAEIDERGDGTHDQMLVDCKKCMAKLAAVH